MRCPKCGSFTFDHLEVCTKCNKNIAKAAEKLSGTIFQTEAPAYLQFEISEPEIDESGSVDVLDDDGFETESFADEDDDGGIVMSFDEEDAEVDSSEEQEIEFDFSSDDEAGEEEVDLGLSDDEDEELDLGLSGDDDDPMGGLDLEFGDDKAVDGDGEEPSVDFGDLDISDLAPPSEGEASSPIDGLAMKDDTPSDAEIAEAAADAEAIADTLGLSGLADLSTDGLDLDVAAAAPPGSVTGDKIKPAAKTGTALDDFDIDLGDLMSGTDK